MLGLSKKDKLRKTFNLAAALTQGLEALKNEPDSHITYIKTEEANGSFEFKVDAGQERLTETSEDCWEMRPAPLELMVNHGKIYSYSGLGSYSVSQTLKCVEELARDSGALPFKSKHSPSM